LEGFFEIGKIVKPHGLRGRLKVKSYLVEPEKVLRRVTEVELTKASDRKGPYTLGEWRLQRDSIVMEMVEVNDIEVANALKGYLVWGKMEFLEPLGDDEFYWRELIGMEMVTEAGEKLGELTAVFPTGSNDVYVCTTEKGEILIPATVECIRQVDRKERKMVVNLLPGLV